MFRVINIAKALVRKVIKQSSGTRSVPDSAHELDHGVRAANLSDMPEVVSMVKKSGALHQDWDSAKFGVIDDFAAQYGEWLSELSGDPSSIFLVAVMNRHVVGYLVGTVDQAIPLYRVREYGYVRDVWVENEYRGAGMGRKLVDAALERFIALGVEQVRLETATANGSARSFFAGCGFRPCATEMLLEQPIVRSKG
jgi:GNAT superfamily N-acetyltransferase